MREKNSEFLSDNVQQNVPNGLLKWSPKKVLLRMSQCIIGSKYNIM